MRACVVEPKATFTFLEMGREPFFDMLDNVLSLVTKQGFGFDDAVLEGLGFTVTNEIMDIDSEYRRLQPLFDREGYLKDPLHRHQFIEDVRRCVLDQQICAAWPDYNAVVTPQEIRQLRQAAEK